MPDLFFDIAPGKPAEKRKHRAVNAEIAQQHRSVDAFSARMEICMVCKIDSLRMQRIRKLHLIIHCRIQRDGIDHMQDSSSSISR